MGNAAKPIQDIIVEKPHLKFKKEQDLQELMQVLRIHADEWFVSRLLYRARQHLTPDQQAT